MSQGASQTLALAPRWASQGAQWTDQHSLNTGYFPQHPRATELLECTRHMSISRAKYQMSIVLYMCIYKLICMYINPKEKNSRCLSEGRHSLDILGNSAKRPLGLNSFTPPNGKDSKTGKTCKELTSHLFEIQKRWSPLGQRRQEEPLPRNTGLGRLICEPSPVLAAGGAATSIRIHTLGGQSRALHGPPPPAG